MVRNILREPAVRKAMGFSHFKLWDDIKKGEFPAPIKIGIRAVGWFEDEIAEHQERLRAERDKRLGVEAA